MQNRLIEQTVQQAIAEGKDPDDEVDKLMPEDLKAEALKRLRSMLERRCVAIAVLGRPVQTVAVMNAFAISFCARQIA